jgi:ferrous iron transport protein B
MTCSARLPVYVLVTTVLFPRSPALAALAFVGCYALGIVAGLLSAILVRGTLLKGPRRPMLLELPTYKRPSIRTALLTTYDRAWTFLKNAGTVILAICVVLWWLSAFPHVDPPREAVELRERAAVVTGSGGAGPGGTALQSGQQDAAGLAPTADDLLAEAARLEARHAQANSFAGMIGRAVQPVFAPMGADWQLTIGIVTSFAAREVFVSTMAVIVTGEGEDAEGVVERSATAERTDGSGPVFNRPASWAVLVFYVLAMQCLPTLAVTAREAGGAKWALLQFAWMSGVAFVAATLVYQVLRALGM